jgi:hypothetical protein
MPALFLSHAIRDLAHDARCGRRQLLEMHEALRGPVCAFSVHSGSDLQRVVDDLIRAVDFGDLVGRRLERRCLVVPIEAAAASEPLGPAQELEEELLVRVLDSTGVPVGGTNAPEGGLQYRAKLTAGITARGALNDQGQIDFHDLEPGTCCLTFPNIDKRPQGTVPAEVPPFEPVPGARLITRDPSVQYDFGTTPIGSGKVQILQLQRREAEVIEFEHFNDGSAVFLPDQMPDAIYQDDVTDRPLGIDVLKACLTFAQDVSTDQIIITGHDTKLSQQRADVVKALLIGDRDTWVGLAPSYSVVADQDVIVHWVTANFSWPTDPSAATAQSDDDRRWYELRQFQRSYNTDLAAGLFLRTKAPGPIDVDGFIGPQTWGAIFDCYMRALGPPPGAAPPAPPPQATQYPIGDDSTRSGANAGRPTGQYPFVVLGTQGPGNAPITIAKYGSGTENNYMQLQPLNPQYQIGVDPEFVGQALNVPWEWAPKLVASGYNVQQDPTQPAPPSPESELRPPLLPAPGPRATGCGAHHRRTPFRDAPKRRPRERQVEVVFFDSGEAPSVTACGPGEGPCAACRCGLYDPREYELRYEESPSTSLTTYALRVVDELERPLPGIDIVVTTIDGDVCATTNTNGMIRVRATSSDPAQARIVDRQRLAAALNGRHLGPPRRTPLPTQPSVCVRIPGRLDVPVELSSQGLRTLLLLTRADIVARCPHADWGYLRLAEEGPYTLEQTAERVVLSMYSDGLGRTAVVLGQERPKLIPPDIGSLLPLPPNPYWILPDTYVVQPRDTIASIAERHIGSADRWPDLFLADIESAREDGDTTPVERKGELIVPATTPPEVRAGDLLRIPARFVPTWIHAPSLPLPTTPEPPPPAPAWLRVDVDQFLAALYDGDLEMVRRVLDSIPLGPPPSVQPDPTHECYVTLASYVRECAGRSCD